MASKRRVFVGIQPRTSTNPASNLVREVQRVDRLEYGAPILSVNRPRYGQGYIFHDIKCEISCRDWVIATVTARDKGGKPIVRTFENNSIDQERAIKIVEEELAVSQAAAQTNTEYRFPEGPERVEIIIHYTTNDLFEHKAVVVDVDGLANVSYPSIQVRHWNSNNLSFNVDGINPSKLFITGVFHVRASQRSPGSFMLLNKTRKDTESAVRFIKSLLDGMNPSIQRLVKHWSPTITSPVYSRAHAATGIPSWNERRWQPVGTATLFRVAGDQAGLDLTNRMTGRIQAGQTLVSLPNSEPEKEDNTQYYGY